MEAWWGQLYYGQREKRLLPGDREEAEHQADSSPKKIIEKSEVERKRERERERDFLYK